MATYIILFRFTDQGIRNIKESPSRVAAAKQALRDYGVNVKEFYLLVGQYDTAFILEAPDDKAATKAALAISSAGNVRTETLRAYTEDEYREIIAALP